MDPLVCCGRSILADERHTKVVFCTVGERALWLAGGSGEEESDHEREWEEQQIRKGVNIIQPVAILIVLRPAIILVSFLPNRGCC